MNNEISGNLYLFTCGFCRSKYLWDSLLHLLQSPPESALYRDFQQQEHQHCSPAQPRNSHFTFMLTLTSGLPGISFPACGDWHTCVRANSSKVYCCCMHTFHSWSLLTTYWPSLIPCLLPAAGTISDSLKPSCLRPENVPIPRSTKQVTTCRRAPLLPIILVGTT